MKFSDEAFVQLKAKNKIKIASKSYCVLFIHVDYLRLCVIFHRLSTSADKILNFDISAGAFTY